ncbi:hypothetical protein V2A60_001555 [Cordyceps javanica]
MNCDHDPLDPTTRLNFNAYNRRGATYLPIHNQSSSISWSLQHGARHQISFDFATAASKYL